MVTGNALGVSIQVRYLTLRIVEEGKGQREKERKPKRLINFDKKAH